MSLSSVTLRLSTALTIVLKEYGTREKKNKENNLEGLTERVCLMVFLNSLMIPGVSWIRNGSIRMSIDQEDSVGCCGDVLGIDAALSEM